MTAAPKQQSNPTGHLELRVSRYDQVAGLLVSLLILIGLAVAIMFVIWFTSKLVFRQKSVPVKLVENVAGRGPHAEGFEREMEAPGFEEMPEMAEPQLETALEAVTDTATHVAASMEVLDTPSTVTSQGEQRMGDDRPPGPLGEGEDIIPRWERWEVNWTSAGLDPYASQLDYFNIELGAVGGPSTINYASELSRARPRTRTAAPNQENRLYMTWSGGTLEQYDKALLARSGIETDGRLIMQFYPEEVEDRLAWIEMENAKEQGHTDVREFLKTVFGVQESGAGYEFFVQQQAFRTVPP